MKVIKITKKNSQAVLNEAAGVLKQGGAIVCPTDTIYGLMAEATNKSAVAKIFKIKERPEQKVFPVFVKDLEMAKSLAEIDKEQEIFLKKYWPGKVTAMLKRKNGLKLFGAGKKTIGLRISGHWLVKRLILKANKPLVQTSVNISGEPAINDVLQMVLEFADRRYTPDLIIDAGPIEKSQQSTLADITKKELKILRKGDIIPIWKTKN